MAAASQSMVEYADLISYMPRDGASVKPLSTYKSSTMPRFFDDYLLFNIEGVFEVAFQRNKFRANPQIGVRSEE